MVSANDSIILMQLEKPPHNLYAFAAFARIIVAAALKIPPGP